MLSPVSFSESMDCSLAGSSVHGILQARILEWVAMPSSRDLPDPGIKLGSLALYPIPKCNFRTAPITEDVLNKHFLKLAGRCLSQK